MVPLQKLEVVFIALVGLLLIFLSPLLPAGVPLGRLIVELSAILIFQNFLREVLVLVGKGAGVPEPPCIGLSGLLGLIGFFVGWILFATGQGGTLQINAGVWALSAMAALFVGFLMRNFILRRGAFFICHERGHTRLTLEF